MIVDHLSFLISACSIITILSCLWLLFMIFLPRQWSSLVDRENEFWVRKKLISPAHGEKVKRLEKGMAAKVMAATLAILSTLMLGVSLHYWNLINPRRQQPALPTIQPRLAPTNSRRP